MPTTIDTATNQAAITAKFMIIDALELLDGLSSFSAQIAAVHLAHALEMIDAGGAAL